MNLSGRPDGQCGLECHLRLLREIPVFGALSPDLLRVVAYLCESEVFAPGQAILSAGEPAEAAVVVVSGAAVIVRDGHRVGTVSSGGAVGLLALLGRFRWLYGMVAESEVECLVLPRRKLLPQLQARPEALVSVAAELAESVQRWDQQRPDCSREVFGPGAI